MTLNGKRDGFLKTDLRAVGKRAGLKQGRADAMLDESPPSSNAGRTSPTGPGWPTDITEKIGKTHRLDSRG